MNPLERRLREALLEAKRRLARGDIIGAGLELDAACSACASVEQDGSRIKDPSALLDLVRACTSAARDAERELREELSRCGNASAARRIYRFDDQKEHP